MQQFFTKDTTMIQKDTNNDSIITNVLWASYVAKFQWTVYTLILWTNHLRYSLQVLLSLYKVKK